MLNTPKRMLFRSVTLDVNHLNDIRIENEYQIEQNKIYVTGTL